MFFSLSLAMGVMFTYGSYLSKKENLVKNSGLIVVCDTLVASWQVWRSARRRRQRHRRHQCRRHGGGRRHRPGAAMTVADIKLGGPNLLFVTLQDVFNAMGTVGPLFGVIFYLLVLIAAITSAISLIEVVPPSSWTGRRRRAKRAAGPRWLLIVCLAILVEACHRGRGRSGLRRSARALGAACRSTFQKAERLRRDRHRGVCPLERLLAGLHGYALSEGIAMPLGALLMSFMVAWEIKPKTLLEEIHVGHPGKNTFVDAFFTFSIRVIVPIGMILILAGQINDFFGTGWFG